MGKKECCGCLTLRNGVITIIVLSIIGAILNIISISAFVDTLKKNRGSKEDLFGDYYNIREKVDTIKIIIIVKSLLDLLFAVIGLIGVSLRKASTFLVFLVYYIVSFISSIVMSILYIVLAGGGLIIFGLMIGVLLSVYFIYIYISYYVQLKEEEETLPIY